MGGEDGWFTVRIKSVAWCCEWRCLWRRQASIWSDRFKTIHRVGWGLFRWRSGGWVRASTDLFFHVMLNSIPFFCTFGIVPLLHSADQVACDTTDTLKGDALTKLLFLCLSFHLILVVSFGLKTILSDSSCHVSFIECLPDVAGPSRAFSLMRVERTPKFV